MAAEPHGRYLFAGDVEGRLNLLFKRAAAVNKSNGPFDCLFCVGAFFPPADPASAAAGGADGQSELEDYIAGRAKAPLPTYDPATYLSGQAGSTGAAVGRQERAAVEALVDAGADGTAIDVLLTNQWPKGVAALTHPSLLPSPPPATSASAPASVDWAGVGSPVAATLAKELMPRYHVAGGAGVFFARPPYINSSATSAEDASTSASGAVTRFIGLAPVGNKAKQNLAAPDGAARAAAAAAQAKAEEAAAKRTFWESSDGGKGGGEGAVKPAWALKVEEEEARGAGGAGEGEQYWRYAAGKKKARRDGGPGGGGGGREGPQVCFELSGKGVCSRGDACRFMHALDDGSPLPRNLCFEHFSKGTCSRGADCRFRHSLAVETHLVVSVGEHCYVALPKGPLVPGHVLILPIEHFPSVISLPSDALAEMWRYMGALRKCFEAQGQTLVAFERFLQLRAATHAHVNVVPIPQDKADQVLPAFTAAAAAHNFQFASVPKPPGKPPESASTSV
ncbi:unnamed protein product [Closterium sp. Yama58-4]|nr:unnamed protein product [Closterium sp. Yama58-4]